MKVLVTIVNEHFLTGLIWSSNPTLTKEQFLADLKEGKVQAPVAACAPPPPKFAAPILAPVQEQPKKVEANRDALFAELNAGEDITKRLKKVNKEEL